MCKILHSSAKLVAYDPDIDKAFGSMHQNVMTKKKKLLAKIGLLKQLWNMIFKFLSVSIDGNNSLEKWI